MQALVIDLEMIAQLLQIAEMTGFDWRFVIDRVLREGPFESIRKVFRSQKGDDAVTKPLSISVRSALAPLVKPPYLSSFPI